MECMGVIQSDDANIFLCQVEGHPGFFKLKKDDMRRRKYVNQYTYKMYKHPERYYCDELEQDSLKVSNGALFNDTNSTDKEARCDHHSVEFVNTDLMLYTRELTRTGPSAMDEVSYIDNFWLLEHSKMLELVAKRIFGTYKRDYVPSIMLNFFPGIGKRY